MTYTVKAIGKGLFFTGDCFDVMRDLPDGRADMVLCDLPYGLVNWTNPYEWDKFLPLDVLFSEYRRLVQPRGAMLLFGTEPYSTIQRNAGMTLFKYDIYWIKNKQSSPMLAKVKPLRSVELVSVFSEGTTSPGRKNNMIYNPQGLVACEKRVRNSKKDRMVVQDRPSLNAEYTQQFTNYPKDYVSFDCESGLHPTQKPVALFEYLIRTYTNEGMVVLDNCAGSGTTAIAAENAGRRWLCIERDPEYAAKAIERITKHVADRNVT